MAISIRQQVQQAILESIRQQGLGVGDKIATEAALAKQFGTSRSNVHLAIKALEQEGLVTRYRRRGTFVAQTIPARELGRQAAVTVRAGRRKVHVLTGGEPDRLRMHWGDQALAQLERAVHVQGVQVVQEVLASPITPQGLGDLARRLGREGSDALVIIKELHGAEMDGQCNRQLLECVEQLADYPGRVCLLNREGHGLAGWPHDAVSLDPFGEGVSVGRYLGEYGGRRVLCIAFGDRIWGQLRGRGLAMALGRHGSADVLEMRWIKSTDDLDRVFGQVLGQIQRRGDRPTLVLPDDRRAARFLDLAKERGLSCPEAFGVIAFNDDLQYRAYNITTVAPFVTSIGEVTGQLVSNQFQRPASSSVHVTLRSTLIERATFVGDAPSAEAE